MSAEKLIHTMETLLTLHKSLYELAIKKTDIVKNGDINALNQSIKEEQAHIAAINKFEKERQILAKALVPNIDKPTLTDCLNVIEGSSKNKLSELRTDLLELVLKIQVRNELNQKMIYQSLQFVNFSLSLIRPQPKNYNYSPKMDKASLSEQSAGLFNYKA